MPLVVDKDAIRLQVMQAFERLSDERPLTAISLREIAAEAGMSHTKVLRYFASKNSLYVACVHWASALLYDQVARWFETHRPCGPVDRAAYLDAFFRDLQYRDGRGVTPRNVVMTCALGAYSAEIRQAVREEHGRLDRLLAAGLAEAFGAPVSDEEAAAVSAVFFGLYFLGFNEALPAGAALAPTAGIRRLLSAE